MRKSRCGGVRRGPQFLSVLQAQALCLSNWGPETTKFGGHLQDTVGLFLRANGTRVVFRSEVTLGTLLSYELAQDQWPPGLRRSARGSF